MNDHPLFPWLSAARRAWLYRVTAFAAPLATFYGIMSDEAAPLWVGLAAAVLGTGTAAVHTPKSTTGERGATDWQVAVGGLAIGAILGVAAKVVGL